MAKTPKLTHLDREGEAHMVDVGGKAETARQARASGYVSISGPALELVLENRNQKGDVLAVARIAGIMGAKRTSDLIPLCHPLPLTSVTVDLTIDAATARILIEGTARTTGRTGVEMEALTAVSVAALAVYDMCKAVDRNMVIGDIRLEEKSGGTSGDFRRSD